MKNLCSALARSESLVITGSMSHESASLPNDVATLQAIVAEQSATIASLTTKLSKLEHYLEQLVRARYGPRSEKGDPNQLVLFDAVAADKELSLQLAPASRLWRPVQPTVRVKEHRRRGGGRQELPERLERRVIEHDLTADQRACPAAAASAHGSAVKRANNWNMSQPSCSCWCIAAGSMPAGGAASTWPSRRRPPSRSKRACRTGTPRRLGDRQVQRSLAAVPAGGRLLPLRRGAGAEHALTLALATVELLRPL